MKRFSMTALASSRAGLVAKQHRLGMAHADVSVTLHALYRLA
jgi:hypothetical protein